MSSQSIPTKQPNKISKGERQSSCPLWTVWSSDTMGNICVWDAQTLKLIKQLRGRKSHKPVCLCRVQITADNTLYPLECNGTGGEVVFSNGDAGKVFVWSPTLLRLIDVIATQARSDIETMSQTIRVGQHNAKENVQRKQFCDCPSSRPVHSNREEPSSLPVAIPAHVWASCGSQLIVIDPQTSQAREIAIISPAEVEDEFSDPISDQCTSSPSHITDFIQEGETTTTEEEQLTAASISANISCMKPIHGIATAITAFIRERVQKTAALARTTHPDLSDDFLDDLDTQPEFLAIGMDDGKFSLWSLSEIFPMDITKEQENEKPPTKSQGRNTETRIRSSSLSFLSPLSNKMQRIPATVANQLVGELPLLKKTQTDLPSEGLAEPKKVVTDSLEQNTTPEKRKVTQKEQSVSFLASHAIICGMRHQKASHCLTTLPGSPFSVITAGENEQGMLIWKPVSSSHPFFLFYTLYLGSKPSFACRNARWYCRTCS
jgi:WD40 repeat protein